MKPSTLSTLSTVADTATAADTSGDNCGLLVESRKTWIVPSGKFVDPALVRGWGTKVATAVPGKI
jgi:hypothetical protein